MGEGDGKGGGDREGDGGQGEGGRIVRTLWRLQNKNRVDGWRYDGVTNC